MELLGRPREFSTPLPERRASPAARRSGWRSSRWRCCSPTMAVLDETDSGLDIDALRTVADGVNTFARPGHGRPDHHPLPAHPPPTSSPTSSTSCYDGRIVKEGGPELVERARGEGLRLDPRGGRGGGRRLAPDRAMAADRDQRPGPAALDIERDPRRVPDPRAGRSTASRSPTSTTARPRRSRSP